MRLRFWFAAAWIGIAASAASGSGSSIPVGIDPTRLSPGKSDSTRLEFEDTDFDSLGGMEATDWDSAFAAYDRNVAKAQRGRIEPLPRFEYNKAQGLHLELGVGYGPFFGVAERAEGRFGYDFGRERPTGSVLLRVGRADPLLPPQQGEVQLGAELEWHDQTRPFGDHDPYGNTLLAAIGGYDARQYLRERGGSVALLGRVGSSVKARVGVLRIEQRPLEPVADWHLFGEDRWMAVNLPAKRLTATGLRAGLSRAPEFATPEEMDGTYLKLSSTWLESGGLDGKAFTQVDAALFQHGSFAWKDDWAITLRLATTTGKPPLQAMPTLGGVAGLRAYRPWSYVGTSLAYARAQYELSGGHFRKTRAPLLGKLGLKILPFAEVGAIGHGDEIEARELFVGSEHARWDVGFGVRRSLLETGQAAHVQVDFAWPVGEISGPVRITLSFSNDGLD